LKLIDSYLLKLLSTHVGNPNIAPKGDTAPGNYPVFSKTSYGKANLRLLQLISFLKVLESNLLDALDIAR